MEFMKGAVGMIWGSVTVYTLCAPVIVYQDIEWWKIIVKMVSYYKDEIK